jgi:hypothetical protein
MSIIHAVVRKGRVETDQPVPFADGTRLTILPEAEAVPACEAHWKDTPEAIEAWLKWLDSLEPLEFTEEEKAALEEDREARKTWEKEHFNEHADRLAKLWR